MKKTLLIAALTLMSGSAFASKARVAALSNSAHIVDVQNVFAKPEQIVQVGELATFEWGATNTASTGAEGGFLRKNGDATWGVYLGHVASSLASGRATAGFLGAENPFNVMYGSKAGDMDWGVNFMYTKSDKKSTQQKQDAMSIGAGFGTSVWDAHVILGLANNASNTTGGTETKGTGKSTVSLGGGYWMDTMYLFADYSMGGAKVETGSTTTADTSTTDLMVGIENTHKKDGTDFFYGAAIDMMTDKDDAGAGSKTTTNKMPVWVGIEADAASWLVFRASLSQNFSLLFNSEKKDVGTTAGETDTLAESTAVAAGVGMKWNKFAFDGTFTNANAGTGAFGLDGGNFITNASLTYMF